MRLPNVLDEQWFPRRCLRSFFEMQGLDRAMVIASQAFTALIPLIILASALLPTENHDSMADAIVRKFALTGDAATAVHTVFAPTGEATHRAGQHPAARLLGGQPDPTDPADVPRGLAAAAHPERARRPCTPPSRWARSSSSWALLSGIRSLLRQIPFDWALGLSGSLVSSVIVWTSIPWLLLNRRVVWQRLLPAGILAGGLCTAWGYVTTVYMPRLMTSYSERYGLFGVTIALVGWLLCISFILVASTVVAGELDRAPEAWATRIRYPWTEAQLRPDRTPERSLPAATDADLTEAGSPTADDL